jgi:FMN phosphatase YigB (HAD superfamily)
VATTEGPAGPAQLLIFDVDGVLYRYDRDVRSRTLAGALRVPTAAVDEALFGSGIEAQGDAGQLSADEYLDALSARLGVTVTRDDWASSWAAACTPDLEVLALAARACRVVTVAALSNNGALLKAEAPRIVPELVALVVDRLFVSGELGVAKPDPAAYLAVVDGCGVTAAEALFVDDSEANVAGARVAGLTAHQFTTAPALELFLAARGLLPGGGR